MDQPSTTSKPFLSDVKTLRERARKNIASGGVSDPIVSGLSMDSTQILRFQGLVYNSPGDPDSEPVGQFAYEITLIQPVPEPTSVALLGIGLGMFALSAARRARGRAGRGRRARSRLRGLRGRSGRREDAGVADAGPPGRSRRLA